MSSPPDRTADPSLAALRSAIAESFHPTTADEARALWACGPAEFLHAVQPDPNWWGRSTGGYFGPAYRAIAAQFANPCGEGDEVARTARDLALVRRIVAQHFHGMLPRVLDVPCGYGRHLDGLSAAGYEVLGIELQECFARAAHARAPVAVADMRHLPIASHTIDLALNLWNSCGYFLDVAQELAMFAELRRVLRPGGLLLVQGDLDSRPVAAGTWMDRMKRPLGTAGAMLLLRQVPAAALGGLVCLSWVVIPGEMPWQSPAFFLRIRDDAGWAVAARVAGFSGLRIERSPPGVLPHECLVLLSA